VPQHGIGGLQHVGGIKAAPGLLHVAVITSP